jgi:hypothetical protein
MVPESFKHKKRVGDILRITELVNDKRIALNKKPYSKKTIEAMLRGIRTLQPEVKVVCDEFYAALEKLKQSSNKI